MAGSLKRQKLQHTQARAKSHEQLRRNRQDRKVEKLTGVSGFRFRDLVLAIKEDKGLTHEGARRNAQTLLDRLEIQNNVEQREQREQWRFKLVCF